MTKVQTALTAYMAGILDGEGCVYINRRKPSGRRVTPGYGVKVCVSTTDRALVAWMQRWAGLRSVHHVPFPGPNRRPKWLCTWNNSYASHLLKTVRPFLVIKTKQADLAIGLCAHLLGSQRRAGGAGRPVVQAEVAYRESVKQAVALLNQRGRRKGD